MRNTTTSLDDEPCDYQKEGSCLVPGAVESDRDVTCSGTFWGNLLLIGCKRHSDVFEYVCKIPNREYGVFVEPNSGLRLEKR